jgi:hypothetical protein
MQVSLPSDLQPDLPFKILTHGFYDNINLPRYLAYVDAWMEGNGPAGERHPGELGHPRHRPSDDRSRGLCLQRGRRASRNVRENFNLVQSVRVSCGLNYTVALLQFNCFEGTISFFLLFIQPTGLGFFSIFFTFIC